MSEAFEHLRTVRFGECDPAGVVYYPVFFNWFHEAMEQWFEQELGQSYAAVVKQVGFPAAETSAQFVRPIALGEEIVVRLQVARIGKSSLLLRFSVLGQGRIEKAIGEVRCVCIGVASGEFQFRAVSIPETLREQMVRFCV